MMILESIVIFVGIVFCIGIIILAICCDDVIFKQYKIKRLNKQLNGINLKIWNRQYRKFNNYDINSNSIYYGNDVRFTYIEFIGHAHLADTNVFKNSITYNNMKQFFDNHRITIFDNKNDLIIFDNMNFNDINDINNCNFIINKDSNAEIKIFNDEKGLCLSFKFVYDKDERIYFTSKADYIYYCIWLEYLIQCYIKYNREKDFIRSSDRMIDKPKICLTKQTNTNDAGL